MPVLRPCNGCSVWIPKDGPSRCPDCKSKSYQESDEKSSRERQFYQTKGWKSLRKLHLSREPLCRKCREKGDTVPAREVDHIIPLRDGGDIFDEENLQSLCKPHHSQKTRREMNERRQNGDGGTSTQR